MEGRRQKAEGRSGTRGANVLTSALCLRSSAFCLTKARPCTHPQLLPSAFCFLPYQGSAVHSSSLLPSAFCLLPSFTVWRSAPVRSPCLTAATSSSRCPAAWHRTTPHSVLPPSS